MPMTFFRTSAARHAWRWPFALLAAAAAMAARGMCEQWLGDALPFVFALPVVFLVGVIAGNAAAAVATVACALWLLVPGLTPALSAENGWRAVVYFLPSALLLGFFGSRLRRAVDGPPATAPSRPASGLGWLWAAMLLGGVVPLLMLTAFAVNQYYKALADASLRVERAARISEEHALKVFETNIALINRTLDALADDSDATLLDREADLHQRLTRMAAQLPQLQGVFVIGANGRLIATNRAFPAPHQIDFSDRNFFAHHRAGGTQPYFSDLLTSRTTGEPFFDMSLRRTRADGSFGGTVSTSLSPAYFSNFYREIAGGLSTFGISLQRADGALLAGWPVAAPPVDHAASAAAAVKPPAGGLQATRTLGAYPLTVSARIDRSTALAPWYEQMLMLIALTFPSAAGLMYIGWLALQRTRHVLEVAEALRIETEGRKRIEASLRQSQKMEAVGQLTGGIAHDFNNLLQVVSANLHLIGRDMGANPRVAQRLVYANDAVRRGAKLASQLLAFGRRQPLDPKVIHVGKLALGMEDMLRRVLGESIKLEVVVSGSLWNTQADPGQVENAILNLALNARDAMGGTGKLTVEASNAVLDHGYTDQQADLLPGQYVMLAVSDTGTGMTADVAARAFEPFFTTKPPGSGTGLGLSMVYGFVKQSGGHAKIYCEPGEGTTIKLYLPRNQDAEDAPRSAAIATVTGGSESILVVEDDEAVRETAVEMLRALGYRVAHAANAQAALAIIHSGTHIDLLFTDVVMPGALRSTELVAQAREHLPGLAVLYTSGYTRNAMMHGGRLASGVDLLPKPYTADLLAERVRSALASRKPIAGFAPKETPMMQPALAVTEALRASILLVEDDDLIRASTAEIMRDLGYTVLESRSAEEALGMLANPAIGVLVADIGLPSLSGDVFAAEARCLRPTLKIIFATGIAQVRADPRDPAGPLVLHKPYDAAAIEAALRKALLPG